MADGGLLDWIKTPEGQGLLSAAFGGLAGAQRGQPLNSIGRAGLAGLSGYGGALDRQEKTADELMKRKLYSAQVDNYTSEIDSRKLLQEKERSKQAALPGLFSGGTTTGGEVVAPEMGGIPMFSQGLTVTPTRTTGTGMFNYQAALKAGYTPDEIAKLATLPDAGRAEVARVQEVDGPGGVKLLQGYDKFGQAVGQGANGYVAPVQVNQGDRTTFAKPVAGVSLPTNMTFSDRNAAARLEFDRNGGAEAGKPQLVDGQWVYKPTAQFPQGRVVNVNGINDKPLNESQGAATNFGMRAIKAHAILDKLESTGNGQPGLIKRVLMAATPGLGMNLDESVGTMTNLTQSDAQQRAEQAQTDFVTAVLRKESGASISPGEFGTARRQYFPQPGDNEAVILQKQRNRESAIEGLKVQAGPGAKNIAQSIAATPAAVAPYQDKLKETSYQQWKAKQLANKQ